MGGGFWLKMMGAILLFGVGAFLVFVIFDAVWTRVGFLGAMGFIFVILLAVAWWGDRKRSNPDY